MTKAAILSALALSLPAFAAQDGAPLRASLIGYQEVPSVSSKADGEFEARIAADGQSFDYTLAWEGLQADVLMAHIHFAQKGVSGLATMTGSDVVVMFQKDGQMNVATSIDVKGAPRK